MMLQCISPQGKTSFFEGGVKLETNSLSFLLLIVIPALKGR